MGRLDGKVAVITGGASGIGKASVKLFVEEGARVVFGDIQDERGQALANELGENALFLHCNVRKESDIKALIDLAVNKFKRLDIMFNNAGFGGAYGPIDETPADAFDVTIEVLFRSVFLGIKHAAPIMKKQKSGTIINISSIRTAFILVAADFESNKFSPSRQPCLTIIVLSLVFKQFGQILKSICRLLSSICD